jgi:hypothetical protein
MAEIESRENLQRFRRLALQNDELLGRLRLTEDVDSFVELMVQLGREHNCRFTVEQVHGALQEQRRAWLEKWI